MGDMFTGAADLSGIFKNAEPIHITTVVHKAFIEVNEKGTVATGATGKQRSLVI